jgi:hypothetical protein
MNWQEASAIGIVALTFVLMVRSGLRLITLDRGRNCSGCSCSTEQSPSLKVPENWRILDGKSIQERA